MVTDYTAEQLGEISVSPINRRTKGRYTLIVVQPKTNDQITIIEPCDWDVGRARVMQMVRAGVDPADIRYCWRPGDRLDTDGLPLQPCRTALWWTDRDQCRLEKELEQAPGMTNG